MTTSEPSQPSLRARRLGATLRQYREERRLPMSAVAKELDCGIAKISKLESGRSVASKGDLYLLLNLYYVSDHLEIDRLEQLARKARQKDWWTDERLNEALKDYLTLETDSRIVRAYEPGVVHGLLQTEEYMSEVIGYGNPPETVSRLMAARLRRQELLDRDGFELHIVVEERVLHRIPPHCRNGQLRKIGEMSAHRNVTVQVLPLDAHLPLAQYPPFTQFDLNEDPGMTITWLEHLTGATMLEDISDVGSYNGMWAEMAAAAHSPEESLRLLEQLWEAST